jgi:predicted dinucleotide-binding enzyme
MVGWDAGPLANAVVAEGMTSVLIGINRRHKLKGAGIRITGIDQA